MISHTISALIPIAEQVRTDGNVAVFLVVDMAKLDKMVETGKNEPYMKIINVGVPNLVSFLGKMAIGLQDGKIELTNAVTIGRTDGTVQ